MAVPPWVPQFDKCLSKVVGPRLFTLATVSPSGLPHIRTCVFRSWLFDDRDTGVLVFTTDRRSLKVDDFAHNEGGYEACFYFPDSKTQYRVSGFAQYIMENAHPTMAAGIPQSLPVKPSHRRRQLTPPDHESDREQTRSPITAADLDPHSTGSEPSVYPVLSPSLDAAKDSQEELRPPTASEWQAEYERLWSGMPEQLKTSFRRPTPRSVIDESARRRIDSIFRRVDGDSKSVGKENFVVVVLFPNSVDWLALDGEREPDSRCIFTRTGPFEWTEQDVCP